MTVTGATPGGWLRWGATLQPPGVAPVGGCGEGATLGGC